MDTKLTLKLNKRIIERAKRYAKKHNTSLSKMLERYLGDKEIRLALNSSFADFEDAIQYYTALSATANYIVTRNVRDYSLADIPVYTPADFMKLKIWA